MIKNIVFDIGNVLVQNPTKELVKQFFKDEKDAITFNEYIFKSNYWKMLDLGQISCNKIASEIEEKRLVELGNYNEVHEFMNNWFKRCIPNLDSMELAKKLKESGYKIYVLSNIAEETFDYFSKTYEIFSLVDGAVISARVGTKKPDVTIFNILLEKYSLNPQECLLIDDDDTNKSLEVANSIGINGRRVLPNSIEDIMNLLKEYDIHI